MEISTIILQNQCGLRMEVTNYGATLMRLQVPDKAGNSTDVVIGLPDAESYSKAPYQKYNFYLGATVGRYAGRISGGGFTLDNTFYEIFHREGIQLHGGISSLDKQIWEVLEVHQGDDPFVIFKTQSAKGHNGFPGTIAVFAKYQLQQTELQITYTATTDAPTVLNLTNHAYFNLNGKGSVAGHELFINASEILEVDERLIPTGRFLKTEETPYEYQKPNSLHFKGHFGLDTPFVLKKGVPKAQLSSKTTGITMEVETNQPGLVVFTPQDFKPLSIRDKSSYASFPAICLECQNFPDAPNNPNFPSSVLRPHEMYENHIRYRFGVIHP